jgi:hypothetical protein
LYLPQAFQKKEDEDEDKALLTHIQELVVAEKIACYDCGD